MRDREDGHLETDQDVVKRERHVLAVVVDSDVLDDLAGDQNRHEDALPEKRPGSVCQRSTREDVQNERSPKREEEDAFDAEELGHGAERLDAGIVRCQRSAGRI